MSAPQDDFLEEMHKSIHNFDNQVTTDPNETMVSNVMRVDDIKVNDGLMRVEIKGTVLKVEKGIKSNYTCYHIDGADSLGPIDCLRRFNEFILLREMLYSRYPGIYIPPIPNKKMKGKLDDELVEERKYFLE
jgi:hypothetical protein